MNLDEVERKLQELKEMKARAKAEENIKRQVNEVDGVNLVNVQPNFLERRPMIKRKVGIGMVLETVGLEFESLGKSQKDVAQILGNLPNGLGNTFNVTRDGSAEMKVFSLGVKGKRDRIVNVNCHTPIVQELFARKEKTTVGYEVVSVPMDIGTAELAMYCFLPKLKASGDFVSERCATHVHVGFPKNLGMMQNALGLGLHYDDLFYSLAHMEMDRFRGYSNNAIYARPLINGPYFRYNDTYYQVLNWQNALASKNYSQFFASYAYNVNGGVPKYHPARYFSINIYSVLLHETLEFRHFNQCFNPKLTTAVAKLCQMFTEIAIKSRSNSFSNLSPANVFETNSPSYYINKLRRLMDLSVTVGGEFRINNNDFDALAEVIMKYKGIGIKNQAVLTHCKETETDIDTIREGNLRVAKEKPVPDGHVDIHNIKYQSIVGNNF